MMNPRSCLVVLLALVIAGCPHPSSTSVTSRASNTTPRLVHPEQVIIPPEATEWPRKINNGQYPHYPVDARDKGVEARVVAAFVVNEEGRPEYRTISILQSSATHPEFAATVCAFLREGAEFTWAPHAPARALVIMPFEFALRGVTVAEELPPLPHLRAIADSLREMSPPQLAAWVESKPHCF